MTPIRHHLSDELIVSYAAGALDEAQSLAVACHLTFCPLCRRKVEDAELLGGAVLDALPPAGLAETSLDAMMVRLDAEPDRASEPPAAPPGDFRGTPLPAPLHPFVERRGWSRLAPGIEQTLLDTRGTATARLMRFAPGVRLPAHAHRGLELTLVLTGSYHDALGRYGPGDLSELDETDSHQPVIDPDGECVALVVTEAPAVYEKLVYRLIQPFIGL